MLAEIIAKHSYLMHSPDEGLNDARKVDFSNFREEVNAHLSKFNKEPDENELDTIFHPSVQAGYLVRRRHDHSRRHGRLDAAGVHH